MNLSDASRQCLLYTNGLQCNHRATKCSYTVGLRALLDLDAAAMLNIPEGLDHAQAPSLSD